MAPDMQTVHPARRGERPFGAEDLWKIPRVGTPSASPDGTWLAFPVTTYDMETNEGTSRIHRVDLADGSVRPLTAPSVSSSLPVISPDGSRLAFLREEEDAGGKKHRQLHVLRLDGGEPERVAEMPLGAFDMRWAPDGSALVVGALLYRGHLSVEATAAERDRRADDPVKAYATEDDVFRFWDRWLTTGEVPHLFHVALGTGAVRDLTPESTDWFSWMEMTGNFDVSPDGREIVYAGVRFDADAGRLRSAVYRVQIEDGEPTRIAPADAHSAYRPRYAPDGTSIVFGATYDPNFYADRVRLLRYDRETGAESAVLADWELSPSGWEFTHGGALLFSAESGARRHLYRLGPGRDTQPRLLVRGGTVAGAQPLPNEGVAYALQTMSQPSELHVLKGGSETPRRLTHFTDDALAGVAFGEVREIEYEGASGETVQMFLVLPPDHREGVPQPLVQVIHGGPHGISGDSFHPRWNAHLFAAPGYLAALVNFQGSTSWGQDFAKRIQGAWGERPFEDVIRATDLLVEAGIADPDQLAAAGGSYGGYMAAWIAGHTDRFRCIVNHAGVFDTQGMFASDLPQGREHSLGGAPWEDVEQLDRWNPLRYCEHMKTPMLVVHGELDYRVPATQGLLCYSILKARGVPARLLYYPDENHWVLKPRNSTLWYGEVHAWLARWLRDR